jgi:uncharacterized protein (DUF1499 family)
MNIYTSITGLLAIIIIVYFAMINTIYFLAPTKKMETFPKKCHMSTKCTRVAESNTRGYGLKPIKLKNNISEIQGKIKNIIEKKPRMTIINENEGFIHCVDITPFFRFYDDLAIRIFESEGLTNVWLQSQSRLGIYDLYVNEKRIQDLHKQIVNLE